MPLLSIIIPTKNRHVTLTKIIQAIFPYLNQKEVEIIVSDDSVDKSKAAQVKNSFASFNFIKYIITDAELSVSANFNNAVLNATGEYCIAIGDDDLVSPYILEIVQLMKKAGVDVLSYPKATYYWPEARFFKQYAYNHPASLVHPIGISKTIELKDSADELNKVLKNGGVELFDMPSLYHGVVAKKILDNIYRRIGTYVPGASPDMATAVAIALTADKFGLINFPVSTPGASQTSAAGMGLSRKHIARLEDVPWLEKSIVKDWDPMLPPIWTAQTIYAQSIYEVLKKFSDLRKINYTKMFSALYFYNPGLASNSSLVSCHGNNGIGGKPHWLRLESLRLLRIAFFNLPVKIINLTIKIRGDHLRKAEYSQIQSPDACMMKMVELQKHLF